MKEYSEQNKNIASSFVWAFLERFGAQGVGIIVNIVLARLLSPDHYGVLAIMVIFTNLANQLVQNGFSVSLIQNRDVTEEDYSSVLHVSMLVTVPIYLLIFFCAPAIGRFYDTPSLTWPLRALALVLFPNALMSVQTAKLNRDMNFKQLFSLTILSSMSGGAVGILLAFLNFGVWALVGQQIFGAVATCIVLWIKLKWRPRAVINWHRIGVLFSYGWKLLVASLMNTLYNDVTGLVIGKKYTPTMLAYYDKGQMLPSKIMTNINDAIQKVMLPALSKVQDDRERCKAMMRRSVQTSCFIIFAMTAGLAAVSTPLVTILLTEKWLPCVPFMQLSCLIFAFYPIHTANLQAMKAMGRSDMFLKLEIIKKAIGLAVLALSVFCFDSALAIMAGTALTTPLTLLINAGPNKKIVGYSFKEQMKDVMPSLLLALGMFVVVLLVGRAISNVWLALIAQIIVGVAVYVGGAKLFHLEIFDFILKMAKPYLSRLKKKH